MPFSVTNSKGKTYYLHLQERQLKNGKRQKTVFFAKDIRDGVLETLPVGYTVTEMPHGLPVIKRVAIGSRQSMALIDRLDIPATSPFPIQNLPFGAFEPTSGGARIGVAIGEWILDLAALEDAGLLGQETSGELFNRPTLNAFMAAGQPVWAAVRRSVQQHVLDETSPLSDDTEHPSRSSIRKPTAGSTCRSISAITPTSTRHANTPPTLGRCFAAQTRRCLPNWQHLPIAYHGRSSSIIPSGAPIRRPAGQITLDNNVAYSVANPRVGL